MSDQHLLHQTIRPVRVAAYSAFVIIESAGWQSSADTETEEEIGFVSERMNKGRHIQLLTDTLGKNPAIDIFKSHLRCLAGVSAVAFVAVKKIAGVVHCNAPETKFRKDISNGNSITKIIWNWRHSEFVQTRCKPPINRPQICRCLSPWE